VEARVPNAAGFAEIRTVETCQHPQRPGRRWRRDSVYGPGDRRPLTREQRARFLFLVRAHRSAGSLSACHQDVAEALPDFLGPDGRLDPSVESIARRARCHPRTVARALPVLERLCLLGRQRRMVRTAHGARQTSNAYVLRTPAENPGPVPEPVFPVKPILNGSSASLAVRLPAGLETPDKATQERVNAGIQARLLAAWAARRTATRT
jgi:AraC-like DNA-binding protein